MSDLVQWLIDFAGYLSSWTYAVLLSRSDPGRYLNSHN